ncbi:MAG: hypothetical protein ABIW32_06240 [Terrimesophilobacter sp.]
MKAGIQKILETGKPGWLVVNHGRGQLQEAELLITVSTPVSLIDTSEPSSPAPV